LVVVLLAVIGGLWWYIYRDYRREQFLENLHLVGFSTSMIGAPREGSEDEAQLRAKALGIDLLATYQDRLPDDPVRYQLAWMLITQESPEYYELAKENITKVPWPEVRIWTIRRHEERLSPEYREKLLELTLASPTSEGKLAAGRWYGEQGEQSKAEDAFHAAMTGGLFWDALDAADQLLKSERYRDEALAHHLNVVRDAEHFTPRAAHSLLMVYGVRDELQPLVDACRKEPKDGPNRQQLAKKLQDLGTDRKPLNADAK
jgi:hypothetical protein